VVVASVQAVQERDTVACRIGETET
jgi:hypothetical protein